jgi:hypothetical protein
MRKLFYVGFCAALMMGFGCAITNYDLIVNEYSGEVINTNGKARILSGQVASTYADGSDNCQWYVDQKANGDRTLTNYNYFTPPDALSPFVSDLFCTPEWNGCSMVTADDPQLNDVDIFDFSFNANCDGVRSLYYVLSTTRYYGECGRGARPALTDRLDFLATGQVGQFAGQTGLWFNLNRNNTTITLDNKAGFTTALNFNSSIRLWANPAQKNFAIMMDSPMLSGDQRRYADFLANHATAQTLATITYNGVSWSFDIAGNRGANDPISSPKAVLARANSRL